MIRKLNIEEINKEIRLKYQHIPLEQQIGLTMMYIIDKQNEIIDELNKKE